jgi:hypothetical protein
MQKYFRIILSLALIALLAVAAFSADVTGKWKSEFNSQIGIQKYTYEFKVEGEKLTGKVIAERAGTTSEAAITDGKIVGDEISFKEMLNYQGQEFAVEYKGKVSGDEIKLTRKVGDMAAYDIVLKRAQ